MNRRYTPKYGPWTYVTFILMIAAALLTCGCVVLVLWDLIDGRMMDAINMFGRVIGLAIVTFLLLAAFIYADR